MLEILSHQYLKKFIRSHQTDWTHVYSFGRIISKCLRTNETYLINSEIFFSNCWISPLLISLFLFEKNSTFILDKEKIEFTKENHLEDLKNLGFEFILKKDQIIFPNHQVCFITLENLLGDLKIHRLNNHRIIFSGIEDIKKELKNYFRILLLKKHWFHNVDKKLSTSERIISKYNSLKKKFFLKKVLENDYVFLDSKEVYLLSKFFNEYASFSDQFQKVSQALSEGWACWVELDRINFEWKFFLEPLDELSQIKNLLRVNKFVFLSSLRKDNFFEKYLKKQSIEIDVVVNFKSNFDEKKILLYVPPQQMLPNNPFFTQIISDKCKKLVTFSKGLTLVLSDDVNLKIILATALASKYGKRVLLETIPTHNNQILCASYSWWIKNSCLVKSPEQIIIPLLPIPELNVPINGIIVSHYKKSAKDWFREFLLHEAIEKLERSVSPLRRNSGKLIILDGRANKRRWGRSILKSIEPSKQIDFMLPFD